MGQIIINTMQKKLLLTLLLLLLNIILILIYYNINIIKFNNFGLIQFLIFYIVININISWYILTLDIYGREE